MRDLINDEILGKRRAISLRSLMVAAFAAGLVGVAVLACSDDTMAPVELQGDSSVDFGAMVSAVLDNPNSAAKLHNSHLDSLLIRIQAVRAEVGRSAPLSMATLCAVMREYAQDGINRGDIARNSVGARKGRGCLAAPASQLTTGSTAASASYSWTPVTWVDSIFAEPAAWDPADFIGPTSDDYATAVDDAIYAVSTLDPHGYSTISAYHSAVTNTVGSLNPATEELAAVMAEVAAQAIESSTWWNDNGDEMYDEVCGEEPQDAFHRPAKPGIVLVAQSFHSARARRDDHALVCEDEQPNLRIHQAGLVSLAPAKRLLARTFAHSIAMSFQESGLGLGDYLGIAYSDVEGYAGLYGLGHLIIECLDGRCGFEPGLKIFGDADDGDANAMRDQLELELDGMPEYTAQERLARRRKLMLKGAQFMASKLAFGLAAIDAADASYDAFLNADIAN